MSSRDSTPTPTMPRGSRVAGHPNNVVALAGRKRPASGDRSRAPKRHAAEPGARIRQKHHRDPAELYERSCAQFQNLSSRQRKALYDLWLPNPDYNSERAIFMLEDPDQQPPSTLSYDPIINAVYPVIHMLRIDQQGQRSDPDFDRAVADFYNQNHFEVDLSLLHRFRAAFTGIQGIDGAADRHVRDITVCVPVFPWDRTNRVYKRLDWASSSNKKTARYIKTLTSSLSQLKHFQCLKNVTIKFKGPGAEDGSDIQFQGFITQLAACIIDLINTLKVVPSIVRGHHICEDCADGICESTDLSRWFDKPTVQACKNYGRGVATLDEAMQIQISMKI